MFKVIPRQKPSNVMLALSPLLALALTSILAAVIFNALGYKGADVVYQLFLKPFLEPQRYAGLMVKATPLVLIAVGLSIGFKANVWNIGAEGQYVMGGIFATAIAIVTQDLHGFWILPLMLFASMLGGMFWVYPVAILRNRVGVSEILASLMLTYVAIQTLYYLMREPFKDPNGFNFPQSIMFGEAQTLPLIYKTIHIGVPIALLVALGCWFMMRKTLFGFSIIVAGLAPRASQYAGFDEHKTVTCTLLISGALAGLAGGIDVSGPFGQLVPQFPNNYGFTAIIVAFLGRLHPIGCVFAGLMIAATNIGGELAQTLHGLPQAATAVCQALLLFVILGLDMLVNKKVSFK
jgi:simple sugar transport system permease protein